MNILFIDLFTINIKNTNTRYHVRKCDLDISLLPVYRVPVLQSRGLSEDSDKEVILMIGTEDTTSEKAI